MVFHLLALLLSLSTFGSDLSKGIPFPYYDVQESRPNEVMTIDGGIEALKLRLDMIRRARQTIEVEYFIYNTDLAGKIFNRELIKAAKRGVKIRILIDKSLPIFQFDEYYAAELKRHGIDLRYYNKAPLYRISTVQFRNHRKLIVVDDQEALTGGRNIGDDYFDLSEVFNFYDRDVYLKGPIVLTMRRSFDLFFEHEISERPTLPAKPTKTKELQKYFSKMEQVQSFFKESVEELKKKQQIELLGEQVLKGKRLHLCPTATFATDAPGGSFIERIKPRFDEKYKFLRKVLYDKILPIDKRITISSPYLINNDNSRELLEKMLQKGVAIDVYTNSLASTDAIYVAANLYLEIQNLSKRGVKIYLHDGKWLGESPVLSDKIKEAKWGTHCKTQVYETSTYSEVMIGTYNIDNRSNFYNAEMAFFCKGNAAFSKEVREGIMARAKNGYFVKRDGTAEDKKGVKKSILGSSETDFNKMRLMTLPSWMLRFLL